MHTFDTDITDAPGADDIDALLREQLQAGAGIDVAAERSRDVAAYRLADAIAEDNVSRMPRVRFRRRSVLAVASGLAAALFIAGALVPGVRDGSDPGRLAGAPFVPATASAAEVLTSAADLLVSEDPAIVGSGPAWHAVTRGANGDRHETWFDVEAGTARYAWYSPGDGSTPATYYVLNAQADDSATVRQYVRDASGSWSPQARSYQMDMPVDDRTGVVILGPPSMDGMALRWLRDVTAAQDPAAMRAANERFLARTEMWFTPPASPGTDTKAAAAAYQALYLLRIARLEPAAVGQLYRDIADLDSLERLDDTTVSGRAAIRVRMVEPPSGPAGEAIESVLLLDAETGEPLATENESGTRRTTFEQPRRVAAIGTGAATCGDGELPPCALLEGTGPIVARADAIAKAKFLEDQRLSQAAPAAIGPDGVPLPGGGVAREGGDVRIEAAPDAPVPPAPDDPAHDVTAVAPGGLDD